MPLSDLLLPEFDDEIAKTRATLERVPENTPHYKPHQKSMPLASLAGHIAQLPVLLSAMLEGPALDLGDGSFKPFTMSTRAALLEELDSQASAARTALAAASDRTLHENWKLVYGDHVLFAGSRYHAVRSFFLNHIIHHRAQLGVYLRLNDIAVPSIYGPSADES